MCMRFCIPFEDLGSSFITVYSNPRLLKSVTFFPDQKIFCSHFCLDHFALHHSDHTLCIFTITLKFCIMPTAKWTGVLNKESYA